MTDKARVANKARVRVQELVPDRDVARVKVQAVARVVVRAGVLVEARAVVREAEAAPELVPAEAEAAAAVPEDRTGEP